MRAGDVAGRARVHGPLAWHQRVGTPAMGAAVSSAAAGVVVLAVLFYILSSLGVVSGAVSTKAFGSCAQWGCQQVHARMHAIRQPQRAWPACCSSASANQV